MKKRQKGFTLVEMMVVIAVIALIAVFALPKLTNYFKLSLNSATRNIATMVRETYNSTALTGNIHRVVYDLKDHAYWVESGPPNVLLDTADSKEKDERRKRFKFKNAEPPKPKFSIETTITKKKIALPSGVQFEDVYTEQGPEPITAGTAYTHFFPHGITEQTLIHLQDGEGHKVSLLISPLIGKTTVVNYYIKPEEVFGKK